MKSAVFLHDMILCGVVDGYQHFRGVCYLNIQDKRAGSSWYLSTELHSITSQKTAFTFKIVFLKGGIFSNIPEDVLV
jgi:hypothetical protein